MTFAQSTLLSSHSQSLSGAGRESLYVASLEAHIQALHDIFRAATDERLFIDMVTELGPLGAGRTIKVC